MSVSILVLALIVAGCGSADGVATVDGEPVTFDEVNALIPAGGDTVSTQLFAQTLMLVISERALAAEADKQFGVSFNDEDVEAKIGELVLQSGLTEEEILTEYNLTEASLRSIGRQQLMADSVVAELTADAPDPTDEELMQGYEALLPSVAQVCSSHILLESPEKAEATLQRALAGEDFAALAMELSVGPSGPGGGDLGCSAPNGYVPEFAAAVLDAELNTPYGPVETQFGWHVLLVSERIVPSFEEVRADLVTSIKATAGQQLWIEWATEALTTVAVEVESEYGTWTTDPVPNVIPPVP